MQFSAQARTHDWQLIFTGHVFSKGLIISNFPSMEIAFLFFRALPYEECDLCLKATMKAEKFRKNRKRKKIFIGQIQYGIQLAHHRDTIPRL